MPEDHDTCLTPNPTPCWDIYLRDLTTGAVQLVSSGPHGNQDRYAGADEGATPDVSRIFFMTAEPLVDEDAEADCPYHVGWGEVDCVDIYEWSGGTTKLISTGPKKTGNDGTVPKATNDWASSTTSRPTATASTSTPSSSWSTPTSTPVATSTCARATRRHLLSDPHRGRRGALLGRVGRRQPDYS